ncbi:MAG: CDP-alcohol phosphatidyltransferase family protein [Rhodospirillaceae bacterium]
MKHLPNLITLARLIAVPVTIYFILEGNLLVAFWLFVAAGVSDALDGAIARLFDARSVLGGIIDPLADKVLLVSVYLSLTKVGLLPLWLALTVVSRDLLIVGGALLSYTLSQPTSLQPLYISKVNTLAQITLAALVLAIHGPGLTDPTLWNNSLTTLLQYVVAATTILSGIAYVLRCELLFAPSAKPL